MISEAIEMHIELMRTAGESVPPPSSRFEFAISDDAAEELCTWVEVDESRTAISR
jgi:hypothetical protein